MWFVILGSTMFGAGILAIAYLLDRYNQKMKVFRSEAILDDLLKEDSRRLKRRGWTVRVVGNGKDKSNYQVVRVDDPPDSIPGICIKWCKNGRIITFVQQHPIFEYRQEARDLKKKLVVGLKNRNSWQSQSDDEYNQWGYC